MGNARWRAALAGTVAGIGLLSFLGAGAPEDADFKMSQVALAKDLRGQVTRVLGELRSSLAAKESYNPAKQAKVRRDANLLIVLLMSLGLHDEINPLQTSAAGLVPLAEKLMSASADHGQAEATLAALEKGMTDGVAANGQPLKWEKRYKLGMLMDQVTQLNIKLRQGIHDKKFEQQAEQTAGYAAALAAIAQATWVDTHEVKNPQDVPKWHQLAAEWRSAAGQVGLGIRQGDRETTQAGLNSMAKCCNDCHSTFRDGQH